jgi:parvulin-like peptidyl-prolyl isomerase
MWGGALLRKGVRLVAGTCLCMGLVLPAAAGRAVAAEAVQGEGGPAPVLVRIGDFTMTLAEFEDLYRRLGPETRQRYEQPGGGGKRAFLDEFIRKKLVALEADREGVDEAPEVRLSLAIARDTILHDAYVRDRLLKRMVDEERLRAWYTEHRDELAVPLRIHVRHIVVTPRAEKPIPNLEQDDATDEAQARAKLERIRAQLEAGESFALLAQRYSEDRSAHSGGDLGYVGRGELLPALEEAAFALQPGQRSDVLRSEQGFHIVLVDERQEAGVPPFEAVRDDVLDAVSIEVGARLQEELDRLIAQLRQKAAIQVDETLLAPASAAPQ